MEANAGLIAGSHKRNELLVIAVNERLPATPPADHLNGHLCRICGDDVGRAFSNGSSRSSSSRDASGELFVACNECAFPVCRACYEYERNDGNQCCPQCKTRYRRHRGSPRVEGDEEEEGVDDLENEFVNFEYGYGNNEGGQHFAEAMLHGHLRYGRGGVDHDLPCHTVLPQVPLLTNGPSSEDPYYSGIPAEHRALVVPHFMSNGGKRVHPLPYDLQPSVPAQGSLMDPSKDLASYGYGSVAWKEKTESWKTRQDKLQLVKSEELDEGDVDDEDLPVMDEARQPLSRKIPLPSARINPYRMIIIIRLIVLTFFLRFRLLNPVPDAVGLWLVSVICEIWFAFSWILDQFPKWLPINRETYLDRLSLRYEREGKPSELAPVDVFVSTVDPLKEPPIVTANTVLSILGVDYPVDKVSCYVSDDGAAMLTFEVMSETSEFARSWVPFCKKFSIEPRAPEMYFAQKIDYLKDKVHPAFVKERRAMKREYEEFKVRINALVAKAQKVPDDGWTMQDGTPWPGNNVRDHPGMIQVFLGQSGGPDLEGHYLPRLVYVSREKRIGFNHHKKAGAMNACVRVSAVLTNAPYILNLDCDHYVNNSKALRESMCFMMDPAIGKKTCYVQFPQRFDGIDKHDRYANNNSVFFDINLRGLDGIQGPVYVGTGCVFRRQALYGYDPPKKIKEPSRSCNCWSSLCCCIGQRKKCKKPKISMRPKFWKKKKHNKKSEASLALNMLEHIEDGLEGIDSEKKNLMSQNKFEKRFGQSSVFVSSMLLKNGGVPPNASATSLLKEAIHVISCGYEDKTEWGKEIGWIYGSVTEDILTGFKMHVRGWRSIYCMPSRPAFKGSAPINLTDRLHQVLRWALGSVEIFLSRHCPIWYGYGSGLKWLERLAYINTIVYPWTSLPLLAYCTLPAVCLLTGKFIIPTIYGFDSLWFIALFLSIFATGILEIRWSGVGIDEWWRNEQFWVIGGVSAHLFALFQGLLKVLAGVNTSFTVTSKQAEDEDFSELYQFKWTTLLIPPTTLLVLNIVGVVAGISDAINNGYQSWGPLFGKLFFAIWVIMHLYPFLKGLMGRRKRTPTIVIVWSVLLASICSLLWVRTNPFLPKQIGPILDECGLQCD